MIVRGADGAKRELFGLFDSSTPIPRPSQWGTTLSYSGERISMDSAAGLPAFLRGVRLISETAAGLPMGLYRGFGDYKKPMPDAPQLSILRRPNPELTAFAVWSYTFASLLSGNAYLWKLKVRGEVKFLYPVNPACVVPKYDGDRPTFELKDREYGPVVKTVGKDQIIHIPGILLTDPYIGVSVVQAHRNSLGIELGRQRFEGRYIGTNGVPSAVLKHPGSPTKEQRDEMRAGYESRHQGSQNAGRVGMMWGGWDLDTTPVNLQDAQFIESKRYGVQDIGRMLGVPGGLLGEPDYRTPESPEQENMKFLQHGLTPWMSRVEQGLATDVDLFAESDWSVEFDEHGFLRADIKTRYDAYRLARQGGWITANEIRRDEGREPADGGDEIQQTPVGGAANPSTSSTNAGDGNAGGTTD
jgi:HK97 family phage portal protein